MLIEICFGNETTLVDLMDGVMRVGGGAEDEIRIEGMAPALLTLNLVGERLMVTASRAVGIGGVQFPAHVPRLVMPGERMKLPSGLSLRQVPPKAIAERAYKGTACVLRELVGDGFSPGSSRAATLTCLTGLDAGFSFPIALRETLIGRGEHAVVRIRDRAVSRKHARVVRQRSTDFLEAFPNTGGLFLNGNPVRTATLLKPGDVIELGQSLLRYDGPEQTLAADEKSEPTVVVEAEDVEPARVAEESVEPPPPAPVATTHPALPIELVLVASGAVLALIGMAATILMVV